MTKELYLAVAIGTTAVVGCTKDKTSSISLENNPAMQVVIPTTLGPFHPNSGTAGAIYDGREHTLSDTRQGHSRFDRGAFTDYGNGHRNLEQVALISPNPISPHDGRGFTFPNMIVLQGDHPEYVRVVETLRVYADGAGDWATFQADRMIGGQTTPKNSCQVEFGMDRLLGNFRYFNLLVRGTATRTDCIDRISTLFGLEKQYDDDAQTTGYWKEKDDWQQAQPSFARDAGRVLEKDLRNVRQAKIPRQQREHRPQQKSRNMPRESRRR